MVISADGILTNCGARAVLPCYDPAMKVLGLILLSVFSLGTASAEEDVTNIAKTDGIEINVLSDFEAGSRRAMAGDHKMARVMFEQGAKKGDARCMFGLGTQSYFGEGTKRDFKEARKWLEMSMDKGYAPSAFVLAIMYQRGQGVDANPGKSLELLQFAANRCVAQAQTELATRLHDGDGMPENKLDAIAWLSIAASDEDTDDDTRATAKDVLASLNDDERAQVAKFEADHRAQFSCQEE
jgi:TPR repeat protein